MDDVCRPAAGQRERVISVRPVAAFLADRVGLARAAARAAGGEASGGGGGCIFRASKADPRRIDIDRARSPAQHVRRDGFLA